MTSATDSGGSAPFLWITGLSGTGKSTLARRIVADSRRVGFHAILLDGDTIRSALLDEGAATDYSPTARRRTAHLIGRLARMLARQGTPVVVATISLFHEVQRANRDGHPLYAEVLLRADPDELKRRYPRFYDDQHPDRHTSVVGTDLTPEYPVNPEIVIDQRFTAGDSEEHTARVMQLWRRLLDASTATRPA